MATFTFAGDDFAATITAARATGGKMFVAKDDGIYIGADRPGQKPQVCYAKGYDPRGVDPGEMFDKTHAAAGGDDFGEHFTLDAKSLALASEPGASMKISLTATNISINVYGPPPPKRELTGDEWRANLAAHWTKQGCSDIVWHTDQHVTMTGPSKSGGRIRADYKRRNKTGKTWHPVPGTAKRVEG